jgi:hypothetical protein
VTRAFFDQVDDELRGLLGPALRDYQSFRAGRLLKLWYRCAPAHFEAQLLGARWTPGPAPVLEIGLHLEHGEVGVNDRLLAGLIAAREAWAPRLPKAVAGPAIGPRARSWRRVSELMALAELDDPELASEAAECLAGYVRVLWPVLGPLVDALAAGSDAASESEPR